MNTTIRTTKTPLGTFFVDESQDSKMASVLGRGHHPNAALVDLAKRMTSQGGVVLDIGAHIGTFGVPMATSLRQVIAFEPSSDTYAMLKKNAQGNGVHLDARNKGLGAQRGRASLVGRNGENAGAQTLGAGDDIEVSVLDEEVAHADFIKIDVEGMEPQVLQGGKELIQRSRPVVFFELNLSQLRSHGAEPSVLADYFKHAGYRLYLPMEKQEGEFELARVRNLTLMTALIAPRAWMLRQESHPFDILAVPSEKSLSASGFATAVGYAIQQNLSSKAHRLRTLFSR